MERNNKQKSQLNRVERPEGGAPFCDKSKAQQEEEGLLFFPGKDSANEKLRTLHLLQSSQLFFFFLSLKAFSPCHVGSCIWLMVADSKMQFSADSESIFAKEISVSLFVSDKHHQHHT